MKAMILAAGFGTRLKPYTDQLPKPLFPILGRPLLLITIEKLRKSGFSPIIVNCHHLSRSIVSLFEGNEDIILQNETVILGTGGGLRLAMKHFDSEPVLVTNGDIYHNIDFGDIYRKHSDSGCRISLVMHDFPRFNNVIVDSGGYVKDFTKSPTTKCTTDRLMAFTGIHVVDPQVLSLIPFNSFYNIIDLYKVYIGQGGLLNSINVSGACWSDIGTPTDYLGLHAHLIQEQKFQKIDYLTRINNSMFITSGEVKVGNNVTLNDWGMVGSGAVIGDNCRLERVVVWDGAVVKENSTLSDTIVS